MEYKLRPWKIEDLDSLVKYANNNNVAKTMSDVFPHPYYEENGKAFIEFATKVSPANILAIEINGEAAGGIGIHPQGDIYRKNAELGYWLAEPYWNRGIISKAIAEMVTYAFANWDLTRIYARPFGSNKGSQKALEKAGFKLEAQLPKTFFKNGEYFDELIYAIRREV
ncbi:GNAT family N-acetyltransferase [Pontibacter cellulosilyticus]|uniref:GNAT family N-acetyltransferase n=1 Tax=Pontibacter cellulosilyticus TaxID=1720253 RepID=A0A923SHD2_9BACT|nr:GNAT family protein [Pontibacter cellulosilyticus]MBC5991568.1 GNAT family N-acetyltransferase [Pontibacter cellulosilyticus]